MTRLADAGGAGRRDGELTGVRGLTAVGVMGTVPSLVNVTAFVVVVPTPTSPKSVAAALRLGPQPVDLGVGARAAGRLTGLGEEHDLPTAIGGHRGTEPAGGDRLRRSGSRRVRQQERLERRVGHGDGDGAAVGGHRGLEGAGGDEGAGLALDGVDAVTVGDGDDLPVGRHRHAGDGPARHGRLHLARVRRGLDGSGVEQAAYDEHDGAVGEGHVTEGAVGQRHLRHRRTVGAGQPQRRRRTGLRRPRERHPLAVGRHRQRLDRVGGARCPLRRDRLRFLPAVQIETPGAPHDTKATEAPSWVIDGK